jgi:sugar lactone lactonase YvrE
MITQILKAPRALAVAAVLLLLAGPSSLGRSAGSFPSWIPFDPAQGEFPEGIAFDKAGNLYASIGGAISPRGAIVKITPDLEKSVLVDFGSQGALGLAVDRNGDVYVARSVAPNNGVYRVNQRGVTVRVPGTEQIAFPNALAFDECGNLFVTETLSVDPLSGGFGQGGVWRIPRGGAAQLWLRDELLTGIGPTLFPYPVGANGIAYLHGNLYVVNTDHANVVRIPIRKNGTPGRPEVWAQVADVPESDFYQSPSIPLMVDCIQFDVRGNAYLTVPSRAAIVRLRACDGSQETLAIFPQDPLDSPLNLVFGTRRGENRNLFISNGGFSNMIVPGLPWAGPGIVKIEIGIPGVPLP